MGRGRPMFTGYCIKFRHLAVVNVNVLRLPLDIGITLHQAQVAPEQMRQPGITTS